jgi:recombination protein RecA
MSSAVVSTSAAQSRLFIFDGESVPEVSHHPEAVCHPERSGKCEKRTPRGVEGSLSLNDSRLAHITPASRLAIRPLPEMVSSGIAALDCLTDGLPRGCITEICGPASSGRTSVLLAALEAATHRAECCALIDASDALDPHSVAAADVDLDRLLWVRCDESSPRKNNSPRRHTSTEEKFSEVPWTNPPLSRSVILSAAKDPLQNGGGNGLSRNFYHCPAGSAPLNNINERWPQRTSKVRIQSGARQSEHRLEQVLHATDLLLESGGFGLIALDLAEVPPESARRIPLTTWFRFRRAIEHTPTILLVIERQPIAGSCSSLLLEFSSRFSVLSSQNTLETNERMDEQPRKPSHTQLLTGLEISAELIRSRLSETQFSDFNSASKTDSNRKPAASISVAFHSKTNWG